MNTEPASEKEQAIWMANNLLDEPNADPDDDIRTISRQFLRALEEITRLKAELERESTIRDLLRIIDSNQFYMTDSELEKVKAARQKIDYGKDRYVR